MITDLNHISFTVSDLDKSVEFYKSAVGLKLQDVSHRGVEFSEQVTGIKGAELKIAYLTADNASVELIQYLSPPGKKLDTATNNVGSAHVCFNVKNFDTFFKGYLKKGGRAMSQPLLVPGGPNKNRKVVYTEDPDGNTIEFFSVEKFT
jgi:catechol 2,3-dioxygenase-like lactoylglutathione lyase family enzyme